MADKPKQLVAGDDAIDCFEADWLGFSEHAVRLAEHLYRVSDSSGVCCGVLGSWGSGKSSFMKLMDEYVRKRSGWKNVKTVWFTAWDPGGIQDLGDAMLYRFFRSVVGEDEEMSKTLEKLQSALGVRRSLRERARRFLEKVSPALPTEGRAVTAVASAFLEELESSSKIRECFDELMRWLEKKKCTVFLFIDDVDRAGGEQILDILSELRLYVSRKRVVAVLGYSEDYVVKVLGQVLPKEIKPEEYLEKIVTVKINVPTPTLVELAKYAKALIQHLLPNLKDEHYTWLGHYAAELSLNNPRKLKRLILTFTQLTQTNKNYEQLDLYLLGSMLVTTAAFDMGFLADEKIAQAIEKGNIDEIDRALQEYANKNPNKNREAQLLIQEMPPSPFFWAGTVSMLRLAGVLPSKPKERLEHAKFEVFDWSGSFIPILSSAAKQGFTFTPKIVESIIEIVVPPDTQIKKAEDPILYPPSLIGDYILSWADSNMLVLLSSLHAEGELLPIVDWLFSECSRFVGEKRFIVWLVDDKGVFSEAELKARMVAAQEKSVGLKHPFIFQYTPSSKVGALLEFLLDVITNKTKPNK